MSTVGTDPAFGIQIPLTWKPVLVKEKHFDWHRQHLYSSHIKLVYGPRDYRWLICARDGEGESVYIGESRDFENRLLKYQLRVRQPKDTDSLVKAMASCEHRNGVVELQFLDLGEDGFQLNEKTINKRSLGEHEVRLMMENISIIMAKTSNLILINKLRESASSRAEKWIMEYARKHGPAATIELLERCMSMAKIG